MPRIRPLRTKEEIAAVPQDESVTIALEPEGTVILDKEADEAAIKAREEAEERAKAKIRPDPEEDATADLKKQLEDLRKANEESQRRLQENITARQAAEQRVREREQDAARSQVRAEDAEYDAILNAIGAAESEAEAAQRDIALATEASDAKAVGEASRRLARAEGRLAQLEDGKLAIERAKTEEAARAKERPQQQQGNTQAQPTIEQYIDQLPNLLPSQRDWLKAHPESLTDPRKNQRLQGAHVEAEDNGLRPGTQKYFNYIEERLGYKEPNEEDDDVTEDNKETKPQVSAPPSRSATSPSTGRSTSTRITLTPEEREIARLSNIDELTYAREKQKMLDQKAKGLIN